MTSAAQSPEKLRASLDELRAALAAERESVAEAERRARDLAAQSELVTKVCTGCTVGVGSAGRPAAMSVEFHLDSDSSATRDHVRPVSKQVLRPLQVAVQPVAVPRQQPCVARASCVLCAFGLQPCACRPEARAGLPVGMFDGRDLCAAAQVQHQLEGTLEQLKALDADRKKKKEVSQALKKLRAEIAAQVQSFMVCSMTTLTAEDL